MPAVLTKGDSVTCKFNGTVSPDGSKLEVAGNAVLTAAGVENHSVAACGAANPPPLCSTVASVTTGKATKLVVGGSPALLSGMVAATDQGAAHPIGPVSAGQSKLEAS
jgi:hypothetical protein